MDSHAPIVGFALAFGAGTGLGLFGAPIWLAPPVLALAAIAPFLTSRRRAGHLELIAVAALAWVGAYQVPSATACAPAAEPGEARIVGRFLATPRAGAGPFEREGGCGVITVVTTRQEPTSGLAPDAGPRAGRRVIATGRWRQGARRPWFEATRIDSMTGHGSVTEDGDARAPGLRSARARLRWSTVRWRDAMVGRLHRLYGERGALVSALVLARREGLDRSLMDDFAVAGVAHLLAISGFHVGVIAAIALGLLRNAGLTRRRAEVGAAIVVGLYVALIGIPDAAFRAALILAFVAASRARGRPPAHWGALSAAGLVLVLSKPERLASAGFQLSFAGAAALMAWSGPASATLVRILPRWVPRSLVRSLAGAGAATLGTLPIVAWHFERVSLVGIPMTLLATPLVALALPGALTTLAVDLVSPWAASLLAGGVGTLLDGLVALTGSAARMPGVSLWTTRGGVAGSMIGLVVATRAARRPGVGAGGRRALVLLYVVVGLLAWPSVAAFQGRGTLELVMIDVGQGDAIALRTPRGRWVLIDAGPPTRAPASETTASSRRALHPVVRTLRSRGVRRLEALILTHADLDHVGGASEVLSSFEVGVVLDPALPAPKQAYGAILRQAVALGLPWIPARQGKTLDLDGVRIEVLHPPDPVADTTEANEASVILRVGWGDFEAVLTGDAYVEAERRVMGAVGDVELLKVGHHGSDTSTDSVFLATIRPEVALISVGRGNRYGHPTARVVERLRRAGAEVYRTDRGGTVRVVVRRDGTWNVRVERDGRR